MSIPFIDFKEQNRLIQGEVDLGFKKVIEKGDYILGEQAHLFEEAFSKYCEAQYGVGVNSGTDALHLALMALDIQEGDEVIVPTHTFIATALCVSFCRAKPVFVDIEPDTYNIDPKSFQAAITKKTKAVIPVHIYGQPANMDEIIAISRKHGIKIVEDAAQAHGSRYKGKRVGSMGDVACFSFYPTKSLGACGDAGMIVTSNKDIYEKALMLRDYGRQGRYEHKIKGTNSRLDTLQAVVLNAKLKHLDQWNQMRAKNAAYYAELLKPLKSVITPVTKEDRTHVFQTYAILVPNRDKVVEAMKAQGIGVLIHYPIGLHLQGAYAELGHKKGDFPVAEKVANDVMSLPMFPHMTKEQIEVVAAALKSLYKRRKIVPLALSVVIIAKNEQGRIKDCLESIAGFADEIVLVDDESTDDTRAIALKYTDTIFTRHMELEGKQRNFGASKAKNDWIMLLDCDERMTDDLKEEIAVALKEGDPKIAAYWAGQINYMGDVALNHGGWSNPHIRLYNKKYVKWSEADYDVIHPGLKFLEGYRGGNMKAQTIHYSFRNVENLIAKINRYSTLEAFKWYSDGRKMSMGKAMWRSWDRFFRRFVAKKGYKDGYFGFVAAVVSGFHEFAAYSKYREMKEKGYYINDIKAKV